MSQDMFDLSPGQEEAQETLSLSLPSDHLSLIMTALSTKNRKTRNEAKIPTIFIYYPASNIN